MEHYTAYGKEKLKSTLYQSNLQIHENIEWIIHVKVSWEFMVWAFHKFRNIAPPQNLK